MTSIIGDAPILLQVEPESRFSWIILHAFSRRAKRARSVKHARRGKAQNKYYFFVK